MTKPVSKQRRHMVQSQVRVPIQTVIARVAAYVFGVIDVLVLGRFVLRLLGANREAEFVSFVYSASDIFMAPFEAVFPTQKVEGAVFEWSALLAVVVYALIGWGVANLIRAVSPRSGATTEIVDERNEDVG
jgi:uncharacterized protein YggT (Ycf19 family)